MEDRASRSHVRSRSLANASSAGWRRSRLPSGVWRRYDAATRTICLSARRIDPSQTVEHFATMAAALPAVLEADASILIADYADYLPPLIEAFDRAGFEVHHKGEGWVVLIRRVDG